VTPLDIECAERVAAAVARELAGKTELEIFTVLAGSFVQMARRLGLDVDDACEALRAGYEYLGRRGVQ
jgi:hypothetical protein